MVKLRMLKDTAVRLILICRECVPKKNNELRLIADTYFH